MWCEEAADKAEEKGQVGKDGGNDEMQPGGKQFKTYLIY